MIGSNSKIVSISSSKKSILIGLDLSFGKISKIDPLTENSDLSRTKEVLWKPNRTRLFIRSSSLIFCFFEILKSCELIIDLGIIFCVTELIVVSIILFALEFYKILSVFNLSI